MDFVGKIRTRDSQTQEEQEYDVYHDGSVYKVYRQKGFNPEFVCDCMTEDAVYGAIERDAKAPIVGGGNLSPPPLKP